MNWYYLNATEETIGPLPESALQALRNSGHIQDDTRVCREGDESWRSFTEAFAQQSQDLQAVVDSFKFSCVHCGQNIATETSLCGAVTQCPSCRGEIVVPPREGGLNDYTAPAINTSDRKKYSLAKKKIVAASILVLIALIALVGFGAPLFKGSNNTDKNKNTESFTAGSLPSLSRAAPAGFVLIPEGPFIMGDSLDGMEDAPPHEVHLSSFYIGTHEVTRGLWRDIRKWGQNNGYIDLIEGVDPMGSDLPKDTLDIDKYPAYWINWINAVKWCNAYSEMEGLVPCYRIGGGVFRSGEIDFKNHPLKCDFRTNGYRLPTEAEWEKAARGGQNGLRFPWGDTINQMKANYTAYYDFERYPYQEFADSVIIENSNASNSGHNKDMPIKHYKLPYHGAPYHLPVGSFPPNNFGLYDMAGNASELCWDAYDSDFYKSSPKINPIGASPTRCDNSGNIIAYRSIVHRGGKGDTPYEACRVARRSYSSDSYMLNGFRVVCR